MLCLHGSKINLIGVHVNDFTIARYLQESGSNGSNSSLAHWNRRDGKENVNIQETLNRRKKQR